MVLPREELGPLKKLPGKTLTSSVFQLVTQSVRYLGIEIDAALAIAEQIDV
jgi:hypothetical protein